MKDNNRFSNLKSLQRPVDTKKDEQPAQEKKAAALSPKVNQVVSPLPVTAAQSRGGKSSNPEFTKITAYIKKATHKKASLILMEQEKEDFSELVERLVSEWIVKQN
jgi:hypothetical protein